MKGKPVLTARQWALVQSWKKSGLSINQIYRRLGLSHNSVVNRWFTGDDNPLEMPKRGKAYTPPYFEAEQQQERTPEVPKDTRDLTARIFGDPLSGRSALDRRQA